MAARYDFTIDQGSDFELVATYKDQNNQPINMTGGSMQAQARAEREGEVIFSFTTTISNQITDTGQFKIELSNATSTAIDITSNTRFFYDVELTLSGRKTRLLDGVVTISREITR